MSRKTWLVLILILIVVLTCGIAGICGAVGWFRVRDISDVLTPPLPSGPVDTLRPAPAGTLRLSGTMPPTLDPAMAQDSTSAEYIVHLFSGLVTLDADLQVVPDLADGWELDAEGRVYTFFMHPDAVFHDGRPITAQDVVYSIERACDPALGSPVALTYLGDIVGVHEYAQGEATSIRGLRALDAHTLEIEIDAPKAFFLAKLTYPTAFVVDGEQIEREGRAWMAQPNGSGPFRLESISPSGRGGRIVLVVHEAHRSALGGAPALQRVEYLLDGGVPITMYENDEIDIVGVPPTEIERVLDPYNPLFAEHVVEPELSVQYIGLNAAMPPFDDVLVRQAFAHAIDRDRLADLVLKNTAQPAAGILPPGMPGFNPDLEGLRYDPERARELLGQSRYGSAEALPEIRLTISGTSGRMPQFTSAIVAMLEESLGIEVLVEQVEWPYFLRDMNERRYMAFSAGWIADYPDPENFIDVLFHSASAQNHTGYANPEVDRLLETARVANGDDPVARLALYQQAEQLIVADAPWIPLTHGLNYVLVKPHVRGYRGSAGLYPWLAHIYLEPAD